MTSISFCAAALIILPHLSVASEEPAVMLPGLKGEVVPAFKNPNLLKNGDFAGSLAGWKIEAAPGVVVETELLKEGERSFLRVKKSREAGAVWLVSDPLPVEAGAVYEVTGLVRAGSLDFSSTGILLMESALSEKRFSRLPSPSSTSSRNGHMGDMRLRYAREGEWPRKTFLYSVPKEHRFARLVFLLEGPGEEIDLANLIVKAPEPDSRVGRVMTPERPLSREAATARLMARPDSEASIDRSGKEPRLLIDGKPSVPFTHMTDVSKPQNGYVGDFAAAGIPVHIVQLFNKTMKHWKGKGQYDFAAVDNALWHAAGCDPEGGIIVGLNVLSYPEWRKDFPASSAQSPDGKFATSRHEDFAPASYWSERYRREVRDLVRAYVNHIRSQPYGRAVIGYFITGGEDGQFYYQVTHGKAILDGHAPDDLGVFRDWIKRHYRGDSEALRASWGDPKLTFESVCPPVEDKIYPGAFLNPAKDRPVRDFFAFLNESLAEFLCDIADEIKECSRKQVIAGAYYGRGGSFMVYPHFADGEIMFPRKSLDFMGAQGHYYGYREAGLPGINPWVFGSMKRAGILPMIELDFRTWFSHYKNINHDYRVARYWNMEDFSGAVERDAGRMLSSDGGLWWMEMTGGWYRDEGVMNSLGALRKTAQEIYAGNPPFAYKPDTVLVADEKGFLWTTEQVNCWNGPQMHAFNVQQRAFQTAGVAFDFVYLDDLINRNDDAYKVYYFLNPYLTSQRLRDYAERLTRAGKTVVWQYAPGWLEESGFSEESMKRLTGFEFRADGVEASGLAARFVQEETAATSPVGKTLLAGLERAAVGSGINLPAERFVVTGGYDGVLSRFVSGGEPAAVWRQDAATKGLSITLGHPSALTPQLIANIAAASGAHRYMEPGDYLCHTRGDLIVVHALKSGVKSLKLPFRAKVRERLRGAISADSVETLSFSLQVGETVWLQIQPAEAVSPEKARD